MAKGKTGTNIKETHVRIFKHTSLDIRNPKLSSMNKHKKRGFKKYRGQGRPR